jgi:ABC-2 type transport system permease protein
MRTDVARLDLATRRRSLLGYSVGLALYVLVVVALYPAFRNSSSLDDFIRSDATAAALFGVSGSITSSSGWLSGNVYANFFPLIALLLTIGYGASCLAGQDEDGTLCLVATLPTRRRTIVGEKVAAMSVQAFVVGVVVALVSVAGRGFEMDVPIHAIATCTLAVLLMAVDFGLLAMAVGAATGRRGTALGVASAVAAVSYLVSSLASAVSWLGPARYASLFYWAVGRDQISTGASWWDVVVLVAAAIAAGSAAVVAFDRLDLS